MKNVRNMVHNYVLEVVDNEPEDMVEEDDEEITITQEDGNVVRLEFSAGLRATYDETRGA